MLMEAHGWSWRELFTHAERVLSDGVYICRVVYYRRGQKELATFYDSMQKVRCGPVTDALALRRTGCAGGGGARGGGCAARGGRGWQWVSIDERRVP